MACVLTGRGGRWLLAEVCYVCFHILWRLVPGAGFSPTMLTLVSRDTGTLLCFLSHSQYPHFSANISKETYYTGKMKNSLCRRHKIVVLGWKEGWLSKQRDYVLIMFGDRQFRADMLLLRKHLILFILAKITTRNWKL